MDRSRRRFLLRSSAGLLSAAVAPSLDLAPALEAQQTPAPATPGTPPVFGTSPAVGPEVSAATFASAEELVRIEMTEKDRIQAASNWRESMAPLCERRAGPRKVAIETEIQPFSLSVPSLLANPSTPARTAWSAATPMPARSRPATNRSHTPLFTSSLTGSNPGS
jgi:hypothetical protein